MLALRIATALVLAPLFIGALFALEPLGFAVFIGCFLLLSAWEWGALCGFGGTGRVAWTVAVALAGALIVALGIPAAVAAIGALCWAVGTVAVFVFPRGRALWEQVWVRVLAGLLMMLPAFSGLVLLQAREGGAWLVLWTMLMVWAADIGAYFAGRAFGRRKLMPAVSPGKTIEGMLGGVVVALLISLAMAVLADLHSRAPVLLVLVTLVVIAASVVGDLLESLVKRVAGVKDSGTILPGHGGVLDRVDGVLAAAPVAATALVGLSVVPGGRLAGLLG